MVHRINPSELEGAGCLFVPSMLVVVMMALNVLLVYEVPQFFDHTLIRNILQDERANAQGLRIKILAFTLARDEPVC